MMSMLRRLGVSSEKIPPFARDFGSREELLDAYIDCFSGSGVFTAAKSSQVTTAEVIIVDHEDNDKCAMISVTNSISTWRLQETIVAALDDNNDG